jgi:signal transduction histidine kinase
MDSNRRATGPLKGIRTAIAAFFWWVRRVLGLAYSVLMRDSLTSLRQETEQLSSAAVESNAYVGAELRSLEERLARVEGELVAVRELLEERQRIGERSHD